MDTHVVAAVQPGADDLRNRGRQSGTVGIVDQIVDQHAEQAGAGRDESGRALAGVPDLTLVAKREDQVASRFRQPAQLAAQVLNQDIIWHRKHDRSLLLALFRERAPAGGHGRSTESLIFGRVSKFIYDRKQYNFNDDDASRKFFR
jgi:hypothetical protein